MLVKLLSGGFCGLVICLVFVLVVLRAFRKMILRRILSAILTGERGVVALHNICCNASVWRLTGFCILQQEGVYRMTVRGIQATEKRSLAAPAMSLDVGRLTVLEAIQVGALGVGALGVGALGGLIAQAALPGWGETFRDVGGFRFWFFLFGAGVGLVGFALAAITTWLSLRSWLRYEDRLQEWHDVAIDAYIGADGSSTEQVVTMWELTASNPLHVLGAALAVQFRQQGGGGGSAPTVRSLQGDMWLPSPDGKMVNLGEVNTTQAQRLSDVFAQLGLIEGKEPRKAGRWVPSSADDTLRLVAQNWHKVKA
jgi:hypothetical protein